MKPLVFICALAIFFSCKSNQTTDTNQPETTEVWENGLTNITGVISKVTPEKDGQTVMLTNNKGIEYTAIVSIPNLGKNAAQYRQFKVGENVGFRGNLVENQRMIVREVLEMK
jgi:hypothetical protein